MTKRCEQFSETGKRCTLAEHSEPFFGGPGHVFGPPETVPPIWWTAEETDQFVKGLHVLIAKRLVAVGPVSEVEREDPAFKLGQLQTAAARYVKVTEALLKYRDPWADSKPREWQQYREALARLEKLAPPETAP